MAQFIIREGDVEEVESFSMYTEENEGETVLVAEQDGKVLAFAQHTGYQIFFLESNAKGAGTAIVHRLMDQYDELQARNVSPEAAGYWERMGFEQGSKTRERYGEYHYDWWEDEE